MQGVELATGNGRSPTRRWMWITWLALSALSLGGIAVIGLLQTRLDYALLPLQDYFWFYQLKLEIMPVVGVLAFASPVVGLVALIFRFWRPVALTTIGIVAVAQFAYAGLESYLSTEAPEHSLPEGFGGVPAQEAQQ